MVGAWVFCGEKAANLLSLGGWVCGGGGNSDNAGSTAPSSGTASGDTGGTGAAGVAIREVNVTW